MDMVEMDEQYIFDQIIAAGFYIKLYVPKDIFHVNVSLNHVIDI